MTKPIPDKAEVALEYPDKLYIGTFERTARFDAHLDETGISLSLHRTGAADVRKTVHMHFHYALFARSCTIWQKRSLPCRRPMRPTGMDCGKGQRPSTGRSILVATTKKTSAG
jgi:hypothetical protein